MRHGIAYGYKYRDRTSPLVQPSVRLLHHSVPLISGSCVVCTVLVLLPVLLCINHDPLSLPIPSKCPAPPLPQTRPNPLYEYSDEEGTARRKSTVQCIQGRKGRKDEKTKRTMRRAAAVPPSATIVTAIRKSHRIEREEKKGRNQVR